MTAFRRTDTNQYPQALARFLHSAGNLWFFVLASGILFSGDMGASMVYDAEPVRDFGVHVATMEGIHGGGLAGNKACRLWAGMIRALGPATMASQRARPFVGPVMIEAFLDWISQLQSGPDLLDQDDSRVP